LLPLNRRIRFFVAAGLMPWISAVVCGCAVVGRGRGKGGVGI